MTPAGKFYDPDTRPRRPRDVGLLLPSVMKSRHEIAVGDVTPLMLGWRPSGLQDWAICRIECVDTEWVIIRRKDSGRLVLVNKQRRWEIIDSSEWSE